jgi:hypothetical protein
MEIPMKTRFHVVLVLVLVAVALTACAAAYADEVAQSARKVIESVKDAVVTVQAVVEVKMSYDGESENEEHKVSATGTVIDPSGLVVMSLLQIDPAAMMGAYMSGAEGFNYSAEVVDAKIRLGDGTELAADVVLRDRDLDLAFLKPKKAPDKPLAAIDLEQAGTPEALDGLVVCWRLGQLANRSLAAYVSHVLSVVTKPRTFYVLEPIGGSGCPAFTLDGKAAGVVVTRISPAGARDESDDMSLTVVIPCSAILKAAEQAKTAAPEKAGGEPAK